MKSGEFSRRWLTAIAIGLVALMAAACGGDSAPTATDAIAPSAAEETPETASPEEFVAEADAICTETARAVSANEAQYTAKTSVKESLSIDEKTGSLATERYQALAALTPPEELASDYEDYLTKREAIVDSFEESLQARRAKATKKAAKLQKKQSSLLDEVNELGRDIGFFACANTLPPADEQEVKSNIVRYFKKPDQATCKALSTQSLLKAIGGLRKCVDRLLVSKKVKISDLEGVAGVRAAAEVVADAYPDTTILVGILYEGGTYRISRYQPKES